MKCENMYCVYWQNNECILEDVSLDILGACDSCIYVDIDEKVLNEYRLKQLKKYQDEYGKQ